MSYKKRKKKPLAVICMNPLKFIFMAHFINKATQSTLYHKRQNKTKPYGKCKENRKINKIVTVQYQNCDMLL